jgi:lysophospholipase L1-like esterase
MKILFYGDSITDAVRAKDKITFPNSALGFGYVMQIAGRLYEKSPVDYDIVNTGISGNRIVDLYARAKIDCWNHQPDLISILIGINDIWHEVERQNGVEPERFERIYRMLIEDTQERLPNTKLLLCEPFVLKGAATEAAWEQFSECTVYAKIVEKLAKEYGLYFLPLQAAFDAAAAKYGNEKFLFDGVHPSVQGATLIACEWMKLFEKIEEDMKK